MKWSHVAYCAALTALATVLVMRGTSSWLAEKICNSFMIFDQTEIFRHWRLFAGVTATSFASLVDIYWMKRALTL
jgi:hypothetical protein